MNTVRVDRVFRPFLGQSAPCGMNSIVYIGDDMNKAMKVFQSTMTGKDAWNNEDPAYGVSLSTWNGNDYVTKRVKG